MNKTMNERPIPPAALIDKNSVEMLRVWIAEEQLHCSLKIGMYKEKFNIPEEHAWGVILADVARHISNALQKEYGKDDMLIENITNSFLKELRKPTSKAEGNFVEDEK